MCLTFLSCKINTLFPFGKENREKVLAFQVKVVTLHSQNRTATMNLINRHSFLASCDTLHSQNRIATMNLLNRHSFLASCDTLHSN